MKVSYVGVKNCVFGGWNCIYRPAWCPEAVRRDRECRIIHIYLIVIENVTIGSKGGWRGDYARYWARKNRDCESFVFC